MENTENTENKKYTCYAACRSFASWMGESSEFDERGWGNGYVAITEDHPLYEKHYSTSDVEDNIEIHGGITWSANHFPKEVEYITDQPLTKNIWVFGFDTAHFGDNKYNWDKIQVINETLLLKQILENYEK